MDWCLNFSETEEFYRTLNSKTDDQHLGMGVDSEDKGLPLKPEDPSSIPQHPSKKSRECLKPQLQGGRDGQILGALASQPGLIKEFQAQ